MLKRTYYTLGAALTVGMVSGASNAYAQTGGNDFSTISRNITDSIQDIPGLLSALAYLLGILLGVLGIMKIKDHVENPTQTPLKDGAIRCAAGGCFFALPILYEAMSNTIGQGTTVEAATLRKVDFNTF